MIRKSLLFLLACTAILFAGCSALEGLLDKPSVTFEDLEVKEASLVESTLGFRFRVDNPNPIGATIKSMAYNLKIDGREFVKGVNEKGISVKANGSEPIELPVTVNYLDFFKSITDFLGKDQVGYDLSGSIGVGPFNLPYRKQGTLPVPKLPNLSLESVSVSDFSFSGASLLFSLGLENKNSFAVNLSGLDYSIKLGGTEFASGFAKKVPSLGKDGTATVEIPLSVSFLKLGRSAYSLLTKSSTGYELSGAMKVDVPAVGVKSFPFQKTGEVPLSK